MSDSKQIAELKAEIEKLKAAVTPTRSDPAAEARFKDEMHAMAERRAERMSTFSREELADFERAVPTSIVKDIAMRDGRAPQGRPGVIPNQQASDVRGPVGGTSGWREATPLANPPGVNWADRLMDHQDAVDRHDRIVEAARRDALVKIAEKPKSE